MIYGSFFRSSKNFYTSQIEQHVCIVRLELSHGTNNDQNILIITPVKENSSRKGGLYMTSYAKRLGKKVQQLFPQSIFASVSPRPLVHDVPKLSLHAKEKLSPLVLHTRERTTIQKSSLHVNLRRNQDQASQYQPRHQDPKPQASMHPRSHSEHTRSAPSYSQLPTSKSSTHP